MTVLNPLTGKRTNTSAWQQWCFDNLQLPHIWRYDHNYLSLIHRLLFWIPLLMAIGPIHTADKFRTLSVIAVYNIGRTVFATSEKYRPTNHSAYEKFFVTSENIIVELHQYFLNDWHSTSSTCGQQLWATNFRFLLRLSGGNLHVSINRLNSSPILPISPKPRYQRYKRLCKFWFWVRLVFSPTAVGGLCAQLRNKNKWRSDFFAFLSFFFSSIEDLL